MVFVRNSELSDIDFLSVNDVITIHEKLTIDACDSSDPISPPGIKSLDGLSSAVHRQHSGYSGRLKYPTPIENAATLCYGVCLNHPFHNGNKRAALVSLLCHLDKNNLTFVSSVTQDDLYKFMLKIASHKVLSKEYNEKIKGDRSDHEVSAISKWLTSKTRRFSKSERSISFHELEKKLRGFDIYFGDRNNNTVDLIRRKTIKESVRTGFFRREKIIEKQIEEKVANIPYFPNRQVGKSLIKSIRKQANLTVEYGVDSSIFYGSETSPDYYIQNYRKVLRKLAKT